MIISNNALDANINFSYAWVHLSQIKLFKISKATINCVLPETVLPLVSSELSVFRNFKFSGWGIWCSCIQLYLKWISANFIVDFAGEGVSSEDLTWTWRGSISRHREKRRSTLHLQHVHRHQNRAKLSDETRLSWCQGILSETWTSVQVFFTQNFYVFWDQIPRHKSGW